MSQLPLGTCVLDPMCGAGATLLEVAAARPDLRCMGFDLDPSQVERSQTHLAAAAALGKYCKMSSWL